MRFGCCGSMVAMKPDGTGIEIIEQLEEIGYDYIELSLAHLMALPELEFLKIKERIFSLGINCEVCNNFFPPYLKLTGNEIDTLKIEAYVRKSIEMAGQLGVKIIVFGSGSAKNVPDGFSKDKAWEQLIAILKYINEIAKRYNILIAIEPLRKTECNIVNSIQEGLNLVKDVNRSNIKLLADFYHMSIEEEDFKVLVKARNYIIHVHFAKVEGRVFPKEINEDNYISFISKLKQIGYNERVSIEAYSKDFYKDAVISLKFLKKIF